MSNKNKKMLTVITSLLLVWLAPIALAEEAAVNDRGIDEGLPSINGEMNDFISSLALKNNWLLEKTVINEEALPIPPVYSNPFIDFDIQLEPIATRTASFKKSIKEERLTLQGFLTIKSKTEEQVRSLIKKCFEEHSESKLCELPTEYQISMFPNLNIWVQIWRRDEDSDTSEKGDYLIDEFYLDRPFSLSLDKKKEFIFDWKIPSDIRSGKYYLNFFINSNNRFDLSGTPLTVFSAGKNYNFEISASEKNPRTGKVEIDKNSIKIKDQDYSYRAPANTIDSGAESEFPINFKLINSSANKENCTVSYQLFSWGQTDSQLLFDSRQEKVEMEAKSTKDLSFNFKLDENNPSSVYNLKIIAEGENYRSSSNIRFVMKNKNAGIFRFLGLVQNQNNSMFNPIFCLRNAAWEGIFNGKISLNLYDRNSKKERGWESDVNLVPETRCFILKQIEIERSTNLEIKGSIFDGNNKQIDQAVLSPIDESAAPSQSEATKITKDHGLEIFGESKKLYGIIFTVLLLLLILVVGLFFLSRRKR